MSSCLRKSPICFASFLAIIIFFLGYCVPHACLDKVSPPVARFTNFFALIAHLKTVRTISINGTIFQKLLILIIIYLRIARFYFEEDFQIEGEHKRNDNDDFKDY